MFTKTDTLTKYYQCLMGHFCMSIIVIFDQTSHLESAVIGGVSVAEESRIGFTVCLVLTKLAILLEFASICIELPSIPRSMFSQVSHTISTCLFLLFIYDAHPPAHFWISFFLFSVPPAIWAVKSLIGMRTRAK